MNCKATDCIYWAGGRQCAAFGYLGANIDVKGNCMAYSPEDKIPGTIDWNPDMMRMPLVEEVV